VVDDNGRAVEVQLEQLPVDRMMSDIGSKTIAEYSRIIDGAKTIVANGPLGRFENANFANGSFEVLKAMALSPAFTIVGGGHIVAAANAAGVTSKIKHVSTGGGACISFLSGEKLPVVEMLMHAKRGALT
jgi:phosphoglycerate kinase